MYTNSTHGTEFTQIAHTYLFKNGLVVPALMEELIKKCGEWKNISSFFHCVNFLLVSRK